MDNIDDNNVWSMNLSIIVDSLGEYVGRTGGRVINPYALKAVDDALDATIEWSKGYINGKAKSIIISLIQL